MARHEKGSGNGLAPLDCRASRPLARKSRRHPDAASLIAEEFLQRKRRGEEPSLQDYQAAYPEYKDFVCGAIVARSMMTASIRPGRLLRLPSEGDELFGFRLRRQLGQERSLASSWPNRPGLPAAPWSSRILSAIEGDEPQTLAQLQHTSIVPIYSVHEDQERRAACGLHAVLWRRHPHQRARASPEQDANAVQGHQLVDAIRPVETRTVADGTDPAASGERQGIDRCPVEAEGLTPVDILRRISFFQAAAWIVAHLPTDSSMRTTAASCTGISSRSTS